MLAWWVDQPGPMNTRPMVKGVRETPEPGPNELLVDVKVCGVCRTDLHLAEGDLQPRRPAVIPGHEAVGTVVASGPGSSRFAPGDRVGVAWLGGVCGTCPYCRRGDENLCAAPVLTGWDKDGGYAEQLTVSQDFAYLIPEAFTDEQAAPLLCSGIIGYRSLKRANVPSGGRLGIYGFGSSAHLTAQMAIYQGASVYVMTRSEEARALARKLGAEYVGDAYDEPPVPLDSAILCDIPPLNYNAHLFYERQVRSVTANTRADGREFLALAAQIPLAPSISVYPFDAADTALADLAADRVTGSAVLRVRPSGSTGQGLGSKSLQFQRRLPRRRYLLCPDFTRQPLRGGRGVDFRCLHVFIASLPSITMPPWKLR